MILTVQDGLKVLAFPRDMRTGWVGGLLSDDDTALVCREIAPCVDGRLWARWNDQYAVTALSVEDAKEFLSITDAHRMRWARTAAQASRLNPFTLSRGLAIPRDSSPADSLVYFVRDAAVRLVKIGTTRDLPRRLQSLRCSSPSKLDLLGTISGGIDVEADLHRRWADLRSHGEWFRERWDLLRFVEVRSFEKRDLSALALMKGAIQ